MPVGAVLPARRAAAATASRVHFVGRELTFAELHERACAFANALGAAGIGRGDVVAVHLPNCPQYPIAYYGILLAGATFSPTNPLLPPADLAAQLADCGAVARRSPGSRPLPALAAVARPHRRATRPLTDREQAARPDAPRRARRRRRRAGLRGLRRRRARPPTRRRRRPTHDLAHLAYTGGTTGGRRACSCRTATSWSTRCSTPAAAPARCPRWTTPAASCSTRSAPAERVPDPARHGRRDQPHARGSTRWARSAASTCPSLTGTHDGAARAVRPGRPTSPTPSGSASRRIGGAPPLFVALLRHPDFATRDLSSRARHLQLGAAPLPVELIKALQRAVRRRRRDRRGLRAHRGDDGRHAGPAARSALRKVGHGRRSRCPTPRSASSTAGGGDPLPAGRARRGVHPRPAGDARLPGPARGDRRGARGRLAAHRRRRRPRRGRLPVDRRPQQGHAALQGLQRVPAGAGGAAVRRPGVAGAAVVGRPDPLAGELPVAFVVAPALAEADAAPR